MDNADNHSDVVEETFQAQRRLKQFFTLFVYGGVSTLIFGALMEAGRQI